MPTSERLLAAHLAQAIVLYLPQARRDGVPDSVLGDLVAIGDRLMARSGQQRPNVAVDGPGGDGGGVTPLLVGYRDAAAVLGVGERTVRRLVADGTLPSMRVGQRVLVHVDDLAAYAASLRHDWRADIVTKGPLDAENSPRRHRSVVVRRRAG